MGSRGPYQHQVTSHWVSGVAKTKNRLGGLGGPTVDCFLAQEWMRNESWRSHRGPIQLLTAKTLARGAQGQEKRIAHDCHDFENE